jgi:hypothetical protein
MIREQTMPKADHQVHVDDVITVKTGEINSPPTPSTVADTADSPPPSPPACPADESVLRTGAFCQPRDHVRRLVQRALVEIYGRDGPDLGESEDMCHRKVDAWLRKHDRRTVSRATLRRAKNGLRSKLRQSAIDLA